MTATKLLMSDRSGDAGDRQGKRPWLPPGGFREFPIWTVLAVVLILSSVIVWFSVDTDTLLSWGIFPAEEDVGFNAVLTIGSIVWMIAVGTLLAKCLEGNPSRAWGIAVIPSIYLASYWVIGAKTIVGGMMEGLPDSLGLFALWAFCGGMGILVCVIAIAGLLSIAMMSAVLADTTRAESKPTPKPPARAITVVSRVSGHHHGGVDVTPEQLPALPELPDGGPPQLAAG